METIIKQTRKLGTSSGVVLPVSWLGQTVSVTLISPDYLLDTLNILKKENVLDVKAIYLSGSYATNEYDLESDIDILVLTDKTSQKIENGKYEIVCYPKKDLEKEKLENILIKQMIKEGKVLIGEKIDSGITKKEKEIFFKETKGILEELEHLLKTINVSYFGTQNLIIYSTVLRIRTFLYLRGVYSKNNLINIVGESNYLFYRKIKSKRRISKKVKVEELEKLIWETRNMLKAKGKKD